MIAPVVPIHLPSDLQQIADGLKHMRPLFNTAQVFAKAWAERDEKNWPGCWGAIQQAGMDPNTTSQMLRHLIAHPIAATKNGYAESIGGRTPREDSDPFSDAMLAATVDDLKRRGGVGEIDSVLRAFEQYDPARKSEDNMTEWLMSCFECLTRTITLDLWSRTRGVYNFDATLADAVMRTPPTKEIPARVLARAPEWATAITAPGLISRFGYPADCVWIYLDPSMLDKDGPYLSFCWLLSRSAKTMLNSPSSQIYCKYSNEPDAMHPMYRIDHVTISVAEALNPEKADNLWCRKLGFMQADNPMLAMIEQYQHIATRQALSLLLYLCAEDVDIEASARVKATPRKPPPKQHQPPAVPGLWEVGYRVGSAFRAHEARAATAPPPGDDAGASGGAKKPHVRKAHWHTYWTGKGRAVPKVNWLHPMLINTHTADSIPITEHETAGDQ